MNYNLLIDLQVFHKGTVRWFFPSYGTPDCHTQSCPPDSTGRDQAVREMTARNFAALLVGKHMEVEREVRRNDCLHLSCQRGQGYF